MKPLKCRDCSATGFLDWTCPKCGSRRVDTTGSVARALIDKNFSDRVVVAIRELTQHRSELSGSSALSASKQVAFMSELIQLLNHNLTTEHALAVERKRWNALKKKLEHRYATEGIPARKAEVDSILAEMHAAELPEPDAKCECDGGCWSAQGCYQQQAATPTEPTPPPAVGRCKTCQHWDTGDSQAIAHCRKGNAAMPFDGSGFCHLHAAAK